MPPVGLATVARVNAPIGDWMIVIRVICAAALALLLSSSLTMGAGPSLKSIMKSWKAKANATAQMLNGGSPYDEAAARDTLQVFVADSQAVGARLTGATAANRDIKMRFEKFSADATAALSLLGAGEKLKPSYAKMISECKSCHDQYAN
jgi:cytochrome c556